MYTVSRQIYYYSGAKVVEVTSGGLDYCGADMLSPSFAVLGEGQEFLDPREAVQSAISIKRAWIDLGATEISLAVGSTGGMGIELEPISMTMR